MYCVQSRDAGVNRSESVKISHGGKSIMCVQCLFSITMVHDNVYKAW